MVWWLLTGIGVLVGLLFARARQKRRAARLRLEARMRAISQLRLLRELLEQTQRHRGLCFGVMSGAHALESDRWTVNAHVTRLLERTEGHRANLAWHDSWRQVIPLWEQIEQARHAGDPLKVLQLHHDLTSLILATIEALGHRHDLICLGGLAPQPEGLWLDLLKNAELLGKTRAVGTGIAARRHNNEVQHQELERLCQLVHQQLYLAPAKLSVEPTLRDALAKPVREAEDRVDELLQAIDVLLRDPSHRALRAREFFNIATQAVSAYYMLADLLLEHLRLDTERALRQG
ncbi:nitrate- and nitrite sensing domain-containing protein [Halopseudomonas salina]|uniref:Nitrate/nitrite sensing protein domain-containing protein n=1 Tax=Halopseudomonas salina TaxID=1323744 RepID=A0ABQ1P4Z9_9GAMM|nr:nitrate- and nitrite sensing domain-containing protein [Halopseudomonas salina]GGC90414.1 hypothetical protein GCM10007418_07700 [Halopseudomonas salina]